MSISRFHMLPLKQGFVGLSGSARICGKTGPQTVVLRQHVSGACSFRHVPSAVCLAGTQCKPSSGSKSHSITRLYQTLLEVCQPVRHVNTQKQQAITPPIWLQPSSFLPSTKTFPLQAP